jgi:hypothetical protein
VKPLTDELLGRRLADRAARVPAPSLTALARSATATPQSRPTGLVGRWAAVGSAAAAVVVAVALVGGLLSRVNAPGIAHGSPSASPGPRSSDVVGGSPSPSDQPDGIAVWTSLSWQKTSPVPFESDETIVNDAIAVGDGFIAVGTTQIGDQLTGRVWLSPDGRSWERIDDPGIATFVPARVLAVGETLVVLGDRPATAGDRVKNVELWHSDDGRKWAQGPTLPVPGDAGPAAGGDAGILLPVDRDMYVIGPDLASWNKTTTWPADVYLGTPVWSGGRWIQPGATGVVGANAPTSASIWTSSDGAIWVAASVDPSPGAVFRIYPAQDGVLALGQSANLCVVCYGVFIPSGVAWASADGQTWTGIDPGLLDLDRSHNVRFVGDGRRLLEVAPVPRTLGDTPASSVASQTLDGRAWTPVGGTALDASVLAGHLVVGAKGVAILPGGTVDLTSGAFHPQPWWGEATEQGSLPPLSPGVTGCDTLGFDARRCTAIVARAREQASPALREEDVTAATLTRPTVDTTSLGFFPVADVRFDLVGGGSVNVVVRCGIPGPSDRACNEAARIHFFGGVDHDVPCGATPGEENHPCATLPPSPRPASVAGARPLAVAALDIALDHLGHYEIAVGAGGLPDGVLSERSAGLAVEAPTNLWIDDGVVIDVRPDDPHRPPIGSIYRDPFDGVEAVHVFLVFDVVEFQPGAVLEVRNLVVR